MIQEVLRNRWKTRIPAKKPLNSGFAVIGLRFLMLLEFKALLVTNGYYKQELAISEYELGTNSRAFTGVKPAGLLVTPEGLNVKLLLPVIDTGVWE